MIVESEHRKGDEHVQQCVGNRRFGDNRDLQRGRHRESGPEGGSRIEPSVGETVDRQSPEGRCDGGRKAKGEFVQTENRHAGGLEPVDEDRFVESQLLVQVGRDEVVRQQHLPCRFAEGPFVQVEQRCHPQSGVEAQKERGGQKKGSVSDIPVLSHATLRYHFSYRIHVVVTPKIAPAMVSLR